MNLIFKPFYPLTASLGYAILKNEGVDLINMSKEPKTEKEKQIEKIIASNKKRDEKIEEILNIGKEPAKNLRPEQDYSLFVRSYKSNWESLKRSKNRLLKLKELELESRKINQKKWEILSQIKGK